MRIASILLIALFALVSFGNQSHAQFQRVYCPDGTHSYKGIEGCKKKVDSSKKKTTGSGSSSTKPSR